MCDGIKPDSYRAKDITGVENIYRFAIFDEILSFKNFVMQYSFKRALRISVLHITSTKTFEIC